MFGITAEHVLLNLIVPVDVLMLEWKETFPLIHPPLLHGCPNKPANNPITDNHVGENETLALRNGHIYMNSSDIC